MWRGKQLVMVWKLRASCISLVMNAWSGWSTIFESVPGPARGVVFGTTLACCRDTGPGLGIDDDGQ